MPNGAGSALEYLSRYLYRGVISESNIVASCNGKVTFRYTDGKSKEIRTETLPGEDFIWRVIQHVLPRGFHRVRDYGFLHHNVRKLLHLLLNLWSTDGCDWRITARHIKTIRTAGDSGTQGRHPVCKR